MNNRTVVAVAACLPLLLIIGLLMLVSALGGANQAAQQQACGSNPLTTGAPPGSGPPSGQLRLIQANMLVSTPMSGFRANLRKIISRGPGIVTLNETESKPNSAMRVNGYGLYRSSAPSVARNAEDEAILWQTSGWSEVAHGTAEISHPIPGTHVPGFKLRTDWRYASWVTLRSTSGSGQVSVIATHTMVNPRHDHVRGHDPRKTADQRSFRTVAALAQQLRSSGPVVMAGDLNSVWPRHGHGAEWWGPQPAMAQSGLQPTYAKLGAPARTDVHGGDPDQIYYSAGLTPTAETTFALHSDHRAVLTDFSFGSSSGATPGGAQNVSTTKGSHRGHGRHGTKKPAKKSHAGHAASAQKVAATSSSTSGAASLPQVPGYSAQQIYNAAQVVKAGRDMGVPLRGQAVGLMTALGESGMNEVNHGDAAGPDSRGLFQQRANGAWGSLSDRMNPYISATNFYKALMKVPNWQSMPPTLAAHAVQANADPNYYTPYWSKGVHLLAALDGSGAINALAADTGGICPGGAVPAAFLQSNGSTVGQFSQAQLIARTQRFIAAGATDPFYGSNSGTWHDRCQHFVANLSGRYSSGYGTAAEGWATISAQGGAHPAGSPGGNSPPIGAWLYYGPNHVAVYLGNGQVASTDVFNNGRVGIGPATAITNGPWHLTYLGWTAPFGGH